MKKDWKYILYLTLAIGIFVVIKLLSPKQYDWTVSFSPDDKNPYGAYVLNELIPSLFPGKKITHSYETFYEIKDSLKRSGNVLIISSHINMEKADTKALLRHVSEGGSVFISSQRFWGSLSDTLRMSTTDYYFSLNNVMNQQSDTSYLHFVNTAFDTAQHYFYRRNNVHTYFNRYDTITTSVIAKNDYGKPIALKINVGKGSIILNSTPLIFTNIYLVSANNHEFISALLSYLPAEALEWTSYYHWGRMEARTPLRFVLTQEPLAWAYYLTIVALLMFMVFEMKRRQRIIPVIKPLENTTLEFVGTIGNLYFQTRQHKSIAEKRINFFLDRVRTKYWLSTARLDDYFIKTLSKKTGKDEDIIRQLVNTIQAIQQQNEITAEELLKLNKHLEKFNDRS